MAYKEFATEALLSQLIGVEATAKLYRGALAPLFEKAHAEDASGTLLVARELISRWLAEELAERDALTSPEMVKEYLRLHFAGQGYETFVVLFLDSQNRLIAAEELFRGTLTQTAVYPREVAKRGLDLGAGSVILAHNHPSGVGEPSEADRILTAQLRKALALLEISVLDHLVVAGNTAVSFAERGII